MASVLPMLELGKRYMDPTGGEIIDALISEMPILVDAIHNNDGITIRRIMNEQHQSLNTLTPHVTHPEARKIQSERMDAFNSLVTCLNQGKCGFQAYFHFLKGCFHSLKKLFSLTEMNE